jgi:hypothetical protein
MRRLRANRAALGLALLALAGCHAPSPTDAPTSRAARDPIASESTFTEPLPAPKPPKPAPSATPVPVPLPAPAPDAIQSRNPTEVLAAWGHAVEARDWAKVRGFWGQHGTASGLSPRAFATRWSVLKKPQVTIDIGLGDAGAGSLFYTAPVTITDGARRIAGQVSLRRVNDVDGASAEQLRWHIEKSSVTP